MTTTDDATARPAPAYPVAQPASGDDPRFCFGLAYDVATVLRHYGYPPVLTGRDLVNLQHALFTFIYRHPLEPR